ncbi:fragmin A [Polychytrium aggregatum]|uniref:fragmin A n=1 Tax=Polychytrium aggregatum TaxID=110093 RepID=UPI0022FE5D5E|nr:fragmin A [Polychytrium aggregatum]KAI9208766.1 fragmin A [Polychytrium aggregatum]
MLGSIVQLDKKARLDASNHERAWDGVGQKVELRIWRIKQFEVVPVPANEYGQFYSGDSYIILNTWKDPNGPQLHYDVHFWLGLSTTQDEAGTAAYKTVELDDHLGTLPIQHREVEGYESDLFRSYFKVIRILDGGFETGFHHVQVKDYTPRLLHFHGPDRGGLKGNVVLTQVPLSYKSLNSGDTFILDKGLVLIQWNGSASSPAERVRAAQICRQLDDERNGQAKVIVFEESDNDASEFWEGIGGRGPIKSASEAYVQGTEPSFTKVLYSISRLSEPAAGNLKFSKVAEGTAVQRGLLNSGDVFIYDDGSHVWAWIGKHASANERRQAMSYALDYINQNARPIYLTVSRVIEGSEGSHFFEALAK